MGIKPFLTCRLIALDKNPGVRLIGICEVPRQIISKAILFILKNDIQDAVGSLQLCGGQVAGNQFHPRERRNLSSPQSSVVEKVYDQLYAATSDGSNYYREGYVCKHCFNLVVKYDKLAVSLQEMKDVLTANPAPRTSATRKRSHPAPTGSMSK